MCFEKNMKNITSEKYCDCPMECNSISYSFSVKSTKFDETEMCQREGIKANFLMKEFYEHKYPPKYVRKLIELKDNVSSDTMDYCKKNLQYRAEAIFRLATDSMSVTVMSRRLSFFDKMSAFGSIINSMNFNFQISCFHIFLGGTLGLFTGISILSMIELVFWLLRYLMGLVKPLPKA